MNRSTSSAKSKTLGHSRHHRWFVNRHGCLGVMPEGACCRGSRGHWGWRSTVWRVYEHRTKAKFPFQLCVCGCKYKFTIWPKICGHSVHKTIFTLYYPVTLDNRVLCGKRPVSTCSHDYKEVRFPVWCGKTWLACNPCPTQHQQCFPLLRTHHPASELDLTNACLPKWRPLEQSQGHIVYSFEKQLIHYN